MSIREVPMYEVRCDEPGCEIRTLDVSMSFSCWTEEGAARDEWIDADQQEIRGDGVLTHYCAKHARPVCSACDATTDLVLDVPGGDLFCPACLTEATP